MTIPSPSRLISSQITSDDESRYNASLNTVLQEPTSRHDLPAIPLESEDDDSNDRDFVSPLRKRSLFHSLQHDLSVSSNLSLPSIGSGTSSRVQPDSSKLTPISGGSTPVIDPMGKEFAKVSSLLNTKKKTRTSVSSNNSSAPSIHSKQSPSSPQNSFMSTTLSPHSRRDEFEKVSILLQRKSSEPKTQYTVNDFGQSMKRSGSPTDLLSVASKSTDGHGVWSTPQVKEMPKPLSNSTSDSVEEPFSTLSVAQTSQSHDDLAVQTLVVIDDNDNDNQQHTSDPTPITQPLPSTPKLPEGEFAPNPIVNDLSIPGEFPLSPSPDAQSPPLNSTPKIFPENDSMSLKDSSVKMKRKPNSTSSFLHNLVTPEVPNRVEPKTPWGPLRSLQRISESGDSPTDDLTPDDILARRMEELGRIRRMESRSLMAQSNPSTETTPQRPSQPNRTIGAPKTELRPQLQTLQEENSSDVTTMLREAYVERQRELQTQLDKALAELREVQAQNKRLTSENQSQQRSISRLNTVLDEVKREKDRSLTQIQNQLHDATASLTVLNNEKKGWQNKLDSMQHKLSAAERQVRCLDHLTRHKLESRQEAGYEQPKRRGLLASTPASADVIGAMRALNEEIYQTCVQLVEGLERRSASLTKHKSQVQKVLGNHLTAMIEDQATQTTSGYNMLLMQTVLEVFMTHWCSSIIEAFYPQQESFADLLVQLSTQTTTASGK